MIDFEDGVSLQVVETMLGEVMDSMEFSGAIRKEDQSNYVIDGEIIFEICQSVSGILNRKFNKQSDILNGKLNENNKIMCGDTEYEIDQAYREGAEAMRAGMPWDSNRYPDSEEKSDQWSYGHTNESEGEHIRDGVDVIKAASAGLMF